MKWEQWLPKREDGLCRCGCGKPAAKSPKGRPTQWAAEACRDAKLVEFWIEKGNNREIRKAVFARDAGVCALCGLDTEAERKACLRWGNPAAADEVEAKRRHYMLAGFPSPVDTWWQADHTTPVVLGGANTLANLRTLCIRCHKAESRKLAARRAQARRGEQYGLSHFLFPMPDTVSLNLG